MRCSRGRPTSCGVCAALVSSVWVPVLVVKFCRASKANGFPRMPTLKVSSSGVITSVICCNCTHPQASLNPPKILHLLSAGVSTRAAGFDTTSVTRMTSSH